MMSNESKMSKLKADLNKLKEIDAVLLDSTKDLSLEDEDRLTDEYAEVANHAIDALIDLLGIERKVASKMVEEPYRDNILNILAKMS